MPSILKWLSQLIIRFFAFLERTFIDLTRPFCHSIAFSTASDLPRSKSQLVTENALLPQQLIILHRQVKKPRFTQSDRRWLVLLASRVHHWKDTLLILKPDTLLRWHCHRFRLFWKFKSHNHGGRPKLTTETISLIQQMAKENLLWRAERTPSAVANFSSWIFGSPPPRFKKYVRLARPPRAPNQTWSVFLTNHAKDIWACDFLPMFDLFFRQVYLFFIVELASRRIVHFNVTGHPTDAWVAQQLREATSFGQAPRFLIWDRDSNALRGQTFTQVAAGSKIEILKTP